MQEAPDTPCSLEHSLCCSALLCCNQPWLQGWDKQYDEWVVARDLVKWDEKLLKVDLTKESTGLPQAMVEGEVDENGSGKLLEPCLAVRESAGWLLLEGACSCSECRCSGAGQACAKRYPPAHPHMGTSSRQINLVLRCLWALCARPVFEATTGAAREQHLPGCCTRAASSRRLCACCVWSPSRSARLWQAAQQFGRRHTR